MDLPNFHGIESGLTGLLIFMLGYLIVLNSLSEFSFGRLAARLFFSLIILAGVLTTFKQRWLHGFAIVLAVASLALNWVVEIRPGGALTTLNAGLSLIFLGFLLAVVVVQVFGEGPVTGHRIRGAIVVYLLLGTIWALLYQVVFLTIPQAFRLPEGITGGDPDALQRLLTYFSFITLTTTGYGDITPVHPVARSLTMLEALVGQLYPAITMARLVSLAVMHKYEKTQINEAIERANELYKNNLRWDLKESPHLHPKLLIYGINASIHVIDNKGPGHRLAHPAIHGGGPVEIYCACWHVYYDIFKFLPGDSAVQFDGELYYARDQKYPVYAEKRGGCAILITQLCECRRQKRYPNPLRGEKWPDLYTKVREPRYPGEKLRIKIRGTSVS